MPPEEYTVLTKSKLIEHATDLYHHNQELKQDNQHLKHELAQLKRMIHGSRSERFVPDEVSDEQLTLEMEVQAEGQQEETEEITYTRKKKERKEKPYRQPIPADLPRVDHILEPEDKQEGMVRIGEEITEELEYTPPEFLVNRYIRPKYVWPEQEEKGVLIAAPPSRPIPKAIAGPALLAIIMIDKFVYHLPFYRQMQKYKRQGITLPVSTLCGWNAKTCELLEPLYKTLLKLVLQSGYIQADETPIRVMDKQKKGKTHRGYHWVYHSPEQGLVLFDYRPGRGTEGPAQLLRNYKGYLQTDGYSVYEYFEQRPGIRLTACLAHVRRYFDQALHNDRKRAEAALLLIQGIYDIERKAREQKMDQEQRKALRLEKARPLMDELGNWLKDNYQQVLPKSPIGKAMQYLLGRFNYMARYLEDGRLEIDNNLAENQIRPVAIGRKNYLFAGSHDGARRAAMLYSLFGTCKAHDVDPFQWLRDVLSRINDHPMQRLEVLLPHKWKTLKDQEEIQGV